MPNTPSNSNNRTRPRTISSLAPSATRRSRRIAASFRTSARISLVAAAPILRTLGSRISVRTLTRVSPPAARTMSEICDRTLLAAIANSSIRMVSGTSASSISVHSCSSPRRCCATTKAAATWVSEAPSSSVRSSATLGPSRLTKRLAMSVARISCRSRWRRMASA